VIENIYDKLREHTGTSRGLGIPDEDTHQDRLAVAASFLNKHKATSLLDVGCGYGDLRTHVLRCRYMGIDVHDWMIDEARKRLPATSFKNVGLQQFKPDPMNFEAVAALGVLSTVKPANMLDFVEQLSRQASRLAVISFVPDDIGYTGMFYSHALEKVVGAYPLLERSLMHGEATILLDIRR
jgi:trans-aconitate methyltransferase